MILPLLCLTLAVARPAVAVADLQCEYLANPQGIDVRTPRLSWRLEATATGSRGLRQTAYRILVSRSKNNLDRNQGEIWDSGQIKSNQSIQILYAGKPLTSNTDYFWKAQVWDQNGVAAAWSATASWSMGLLNPSDWQARWIGARETSPDLSSWTAQNVLYDPWLRKTFSVKSVPARAVIYVASLGYHELYVNGTRVGDAVLSPGVSDLSQRARYVTYDIRKYLKPGQNAIGLWLGVSWSIFPPYRREGRPQAPMALAQAELTDQAGRVEQIVTDGSWKNHSSPNKLLGKWDFMHFGGELYDARLDILDWSKPDLDERDWKAAALYEPGLLVSAEIQEPNRRVHSLKAVAMERLPGGDFRVDMGRNFAGFVEIDVTGTPGSQVDFQFSEREDQPITHDLHSSYILGPSGKGTFQNRFNYSVGRWIRIKGLAKPPAQDSVRGYLVRSDYRRAAEFACSDPLLTEIYKTTLWTFENLSLGGYVVDCPHRERMGYGGDAHSTTEAAMSHYHLAAFYSKWAQDWRDVQGHPGQYGVGKKAEGAGARKLDEGNLPYTAPTYWGGGGPAWSGYCVTLPWLMYQQYGDRRVLEEGFPTIERWLKFVETKTANDMLVRYGGEWDFLGDWLWPGANGVNGDTQETLFFNNCYWIFNLDTAAKIADALGKRDAAAAYRHRADSVRRAVHQKFYLPAEQSYVNGMQTYLSIALLVHLPPADLRTGVMKRFERDIVETRKGHIHAGITGLYFVLKELLESDRQDLILSMASKTDYPSWGDMLRQGATTLWESWDGKESRLHSSYVGIGLWFTEGLGGIKPDPAGPGFQSFVVRPGILPGGPKWVNASYKSPYGTIASGWKVDGGSLKMEVSVPPNSVATLYVPSDDPGQVREGGLLASQAVGVQWLRKEGGSSVYKLQSGSYVFTARLSALR